MCTNGVNTNQLKDTISMIDDSIALNRRWTHKMYHLADNGSLTKSALMLKEIQESLDDIRSKIDELQNLIDDEDSAISADVHLV